MFMFLMVKIYHYAEAHKFLINLYGCSLTALTIKRVIDKLEKMLITKGDFYSAQRGNALAKAGRG